MRAENIPDNHHLHRRVSNACFNSQTGKCGEGAYLLRTSINEQYLSVNWAEKTTLGFSSLDPNNLQRKFKVAEIEVAEPVKLDLTVKHQPKPANPAYGGIWGKDLFDPVKRLKIAFNLAEKSIIHSKDS